MLADGVPPPGKRRAVQFELDDVQRNRIMVQELA
jgi:hypothetical protein